ncbi:ribonuclease P protein subunit p21-like [Pomacea canaliculata]|uniref:ribonuclease P protein subunit p21-like n=1 Tax=Pomacea canaliculata TaxID=400727 RepID=UPI000D726783|nr:ribonuclease P protein subunit p21-like [Pomacea canaliculata]
MGKDGSRFVNKEVFQRINFLYQAAHFALVQTPSQPQLCCFYINTLRTVAEKHVIRLHPEMKRTICKKCCILLLPGITATVRSKKKGEKCTLVSCLECGNVKRFPWRKTHQLWIEKPDAWLPS